MSIKKASGKSRLTIIPHSYTDVIRNITMICETLANNASTEIKASVFENYHNDREICYKVVENYCNDNGIYTDGSIARVMELIFEAF